MCVIAAAEQQRDGSGIGGGSLCRSVDGSVGVSVGGSVGRSVGGSGGSIGSGASWPVYWPFGAMEIFFRVSSGTFFCTYVGLYVGFLLTDLNKKSESLPQAGNDKTKKSQEHACKAKWYEL